jgi:hypothetical protein
VVNKLSRFEESIAKIESSRHAAESTIVFQPPQAIAATVSKPIIREPVNDQQQQQQPSSSNQSTANNSPVISFTTGASSPVSASPASPYSMVGAAFSVSAAIKASNVLSPTATTKNNSATYRGLASNGGVSPLGTRPHAFARAASEAPTSTNYCGSNGSVSSASRPTVSPVPMNRTASAVLAGKAPLVFPKRATPPVPFNRVTSSFQ